MPDPKFRLGQRGLRGQALFDDVSMVQVVGIHRSTGRGGGITLGDGEKITNGRYLAIHELNTWHTSDCRFLDSYTAEYHGDRWVLDGMDEVVYKHELRRIGMAELSGTLALSDQVKYATGAVGSGSSRQPVEWVMNDPRAESGLLHRPISVDVEVARYGRPLSVSVSQDGHSWENAGVVTGAGTSVTDLLPVARNAYDFWVRLKCWGTGRTEVTKYRFESQVQIDNSTTAVGASHYLAVLYSAPNVRAAVADLGDLSPGGRSEVKLVVDAPRKRAQLECRVTIVKEGQEVSSEAVTAWMWVGSQRRLHIPYAVPDSSPFTMTITGRDASSGRLLFLLEGNVRPA